jgi:hypothetical protein
MAKSSALRTDIIAAQRSKSAANSYRTNAFGFF